MIDYSSLNEPQYKAVMTTEGPLLVLAGAGSGKTRVLTYRIAHMVDDLNVAPWEILAITFTNKAANEMRERLSDLVGPRVRGMWVSTFHSMCVRILRANAHVLGFTEHFTIYDEDDSKRLVKSIMEELDIDVKRIPVNSVRNRISEAKNELILPDEFEMSVHDPVGRIAARVYTIMQQRLKQANAFDFDDLLLYAYLLLKNNPDVLAAYQRRFRYLLVDEYQDTNKAQYALTQLLAKAERNIMVVGDDDQSIYSWRGADIRNILDFEKDYPDATVVKLEQNYRSTENILAAANAVIAHNEHRKEKRLYSMNKEGELVSIYTAQDGRDEGRWIAGEIERLHRGGMSYSDMAVFYRTNAQSRSLEDMFLRAGVPYRLIGSVRFFERAEIRDVMAYLSLTVNPADDVAAQRVINVPRRGIGKTTIQYVEGIARENDCTFMQAIDEVIAAGELRSSTRKALKQFSDLIKEAASMSGELRKVVEAIVTKSGMIEAYEAERTDEARGRIENIKEFYSVVDEYAQTHDYDEVFYDAPTANDGDADGEPARILRGDSLADFIEWVRLRTDLDTLGEGASAVTLMTVHASKGLEFDCVFITGMEESLFPHISSSVDQEGLEEERRLAYVAITRARKLLYMTNAMTRQLFGMTNANPPSRFISEIPPELRKASGVGSIGYAGIGWEKRGSRRGISGSGTEAGEGRVFGKGAGTSSSISHAYVRTDTANPRAGKKDAAHMTFSVGDEVDHKTFGRGKVTKVDGDVLHIKFERSGQTKKLLRDYAPIVKIGN
ncbi:MAG: UvrD-helicase domain-containing protein [Eggerthellaceae bacterium]|nr:UvrD-helicase domain-containing protein [Eggerthellaceae bacterium]